MNKESLAFYTSIFGNDLYLIREEETIAGEETPVYIEKGNSPEFEDTSDLFFFGDNSARLTILVNYSSDEWIIARDKLFLEKILVSVQLSLDKTALINISRSPHKSISGIISRLPKNNVIAFGLDQSFTENMEFDKVLEVGKTKVIFTTDNLMEIAMDKGKKMVLWKNLKEMFGL